MTWKNKALLAAYDQLDSNLQEEVLHFLEYMKLRQDKKLKAIEEPRYQARFDDELDGLMLLEDEPN